MTSKRDEQLQAFKRLLDIMDELRVQCPWDKKQTMETLRHLTIEETYELGDAILEQNMNEIKQELGDLLLHIVFYSKIASETADFDITDVCHSICEKLIYRHPHIYGKAVFKNDEEVKQNWEKLKLKEGKKSVLEGVPKSLPALVKATRIQDKVSNFGVNLGSIDYIFKDLKNQLNILSDHTNTLDQEQDVEEQLGDVMFSVIALARHLNINPENALERKNKAFMKSYEATNS